jgi:hypothetical protein
MIKKISLVVILFNLTIILYAQSPLGNLGRKYDEQDGYAILNGNNYHYWLYNIYYYLDSDNRDKKINYDDCLYEIISGLHRWAERQGWTIDYDNVVIYDPNNNLATSVKRLMQSRGRSGGLGQACEVSVTLVTENEKKASLVINNWNSMKENYYITWVYPLLKF